MQAPCIGMQGKMLPSVTTEDNGDVLTVVNGEWSKASGGSGLPEVTAEDDGDVLTVVDGEWDKATPSGGGGGILKVTMTKDELGTYHLDKSWREIKDAYDSGYAWIDNMSTTESGYIIYHAPENIGVVFYDESLQTYNVMVNGTMFKSTSPDEWIDPT